MEQWQLGWLITIRSQVRVLLPQPININSKMEKKAKSLSDEQ